MTRQRRTGEMPTAYVVTGAEATPPVRARLREAVAPLRPSLADAAALFVGMWPLWAVLSLGMLLVWASAMGDSP